MAIADAVSIKVFFFLNLNSLSHFLTANTKMWMDGWMDLPYFFLYLFFEKEGELGPAKQFIPADL